MASRLLKLYQSLPYPAQSAMAGARGLQLRTQRYGPDHERLVELALMAETLAPTTWHELLAERQARVLHRAATQVPYYRDQWNRRRRNGDRAPWDELANWPVLAKAEVKAQPRAFVADDHDPDAMIEEHTSGTTGTPLTVWWSRATARCWYALFEARSRRWNGVRMDQPWAILGGQQIVAGTRRRPPYWVWNPAMHQLYLSSYHLSPETVADYAGALAAHRVTHLVGYPSALHALARGLVDAGIEVPGIEVVITNAESLLDPQRAWISQAFGAPVRDMYGLSELAVAASDCRHGTSHQWPEAGVVEVLADEADEPVADGTTGRLVATGLLNVDMPLVRYAVGDRLTRPANPQPCPCGRTLPEFGAIEGRADDVVLTPDGRWVGRLDPVFKADYPILEAQIVQTDRRHLVVRLVPLAGFGPATAQAITEGLRERVGAMEVAIEQVPAIPRTANGKFRAVLSQLPPEADGRPS